MPDHPFHPTRRQVLAGGLALAGGTLLDHRSATAEALGKARTRVFVVPVRGVVRARDVLELAAPVLAREGFAAGQIDCLVAEGYRPAGFDGVLLSPAALLDLPPARLARLIAERKPAQITSARPVSHAASRRLACALGAVLREDAGLSSFVLAVRSEAILGLDQRRGFEAELASLAELRFA